MQDSPISACGATLAILQFQTLGTVAAISARDTLGASVQTGRADACLHVEAILAASYTAALLQQTILRARQTIGRQGAIAGLTGLMAGHAFVLRLAKVFS